MTAKLKSSKWVDMWKRARTQILGKLSCVCHKEQDLLSSLCLGILAIFSPKTFPIIFNARVKLCPDCVHLTIVDLCSLVLTGSCWCTCNGRCSQRMHPELAPTQTFAELVALLSADEHSRSFLKNILQLEQTRLSIWFWTGMLPKQWSKLGPKVDFQFLTERLLNHWTNQPKQDVVMRPAKTTRACLGNTGHGIAKKLARVFLALALTHHQIIILIIKFNQIIILTLLHKYFQNLFSKLFFEVWIFIYAAAISWLQWGWFTVIAINTTVLLTGILFLSSLHLFYVLEFFPRF